MVVNYQNCFAQQTESWLTNGNIASTSDFIGTTNTQAFILKSNNNEWMRITPDGNVGISTTSPKYKLDVHGSIRATKEIIVEKQIHWINGQILYLILNIICNYLIQD